MGPLGWLMAPDIKLGDLSLSQGYYRLEEENQVSQVILSSSHTYTHTCTCTNTCTYIHTCTNTCTRTFTCTNTCIHMYKLKTYKRINSDQKINTQNKITKKVTFNGCMTSLEKQEILHINIMFIYMCVCV